MSARRDFSRRIELRKAWLERKKRATAAKQALRWKRQAARRGRKPAFRKIEVLVKGPAEVLKEKIPEAGKFPETAQAEKTEIPRALFPE